jgi:hypothetical protein
MASEISVDAQETGSANGTFVPVFVRVEGIACFLFLALSKLLGKRGSEMVDAVPLGEKGERYEISKVTELAREPKRVKGITLERG